MAESPIAKMFRSLRKQGFIAKRRFWCCQGCAWSALGDTEGQDVVFMHKQDEDYWREKGVAYLAWSGNGEAIRNTALASGLQVKWNGSTSERIKVSLDKVM